MVGAGILPIAIYNNKLHFLFGKENQNEKSAPGFSDFGGRVEMGETIYEGALRECAEELTGFYGNKHMLRKTIKNSGGVYKIIHDDYHTFAFLTEYDENLPKYFNRNHKYLWNETGGAYDVHLFEKIEIRWFTIDELRSNRHIFRKFYRDIIDQILQQEREITSHLKRKK